MLMMDANETDIGFWKAAKRKKKALRCSQQNEVDVKTAVPTTDFLFVTGANQPECAWYAARACITFFHVEHGDGRVNALKF